MTTNITNGSSLDQASITKRIDEIAQPVDGSSSLQNHYSAPPPRLSGTNAEAGLYPQSRISLVDRFIDKPRGLDVVVIGAGLTGVLAGTLLPAKVPNIRLTIYDKNKDFVSCLPNTLVH